MLRSMTAAAVARHFGVSRSTISRLQGMLVMTGSVADGRRSGRPRLRTAANDRRIRATHLGEYFKSVISKALEWDSDEVSKHIVGRLLRQDRRASSAVGRVKMFISDINRVKRLRYATGLVR